MTTRPARYRSGPRKGTNQREVLELGKCVEDVCKSDFAGVGTGTQRTWVTSVIGPRSHSLGELSPLFCLTLPLFQVKFGLTGCSQPPKGRVQPVACVRKRRWLCVPAVKLLTRLGT